MNSIVKQSLNPYKKGKNSDVNELCKGSRYSFKEFFAFKGIGKRNKNQLFNVYHAVLNDEQINNSNNSTIQFKSIHTGDSIDTTTAVTNKDYDMTNLLNYYGKKDITKRNEIDKCIAVQISCSTLTTVHFSNTSDESFFEKRLLVRTNHKNKNKANNNSDFSVSPEPHRPNGNRNPENLISVSSCFSSSSLPECVEFLNGNKKFRKQTTNPEQQKNTHANIFIDQNKIKKENHVRNITKFDRQRNKNICCKTQNTNKNSEATAVQKSQNFGTTADLGYIRGEKNKNKFLKTTGTTNSPTIPMFSTKNVNILEKKYKQTCNNYDKSNYCSASSTQENISTTPTPYTKNANAQKNKKKQMSVMSSNTNYSFTSPTEESISITPALKTKNTNVVKFKNNQVPDRSSSSSCICTSPTEENISTKAKLSTIYAYTQKYKNNRMRDKSSTTRCCSISPIEENPSVTSVQYTNNINEVNKMNKQMCDNFNNTSCCCTAPTEEIINTSRKLSTENINELESTNKKMHDNNNDNKYFRKLPSEENISMEEEHSTNTSNSNDSCCSCETQIERNNINNKKNSYLPTQTGTVSTERNHPKKTKEEPKITWKNNIKQKLTQCYAMKCTQNFKKKVKILCQKVKKEEKERVVSSVCSCENVTGQKVPNYCLLGKEKKLAEKARNNSSLSPREKCIKICNKRRLIIGLNVPPLEESSASETNMEHLNTPNAVKKIAEPTNTNINNTEDNTKADKVDFVEEEIKCPVRCIRKQYTICGKKKEENMQFSCEPQFGVATWNNCPPRFMQMMCKEEMKQAPRNYNINIDLTYITTTLKYLVIALALCLCPCILCCLCCNLCCSH